MKKWKKMRILSAFLTAFLLNGVLAGTDSDMYATRQITAEAADSSGGCVEITGQNFERTTFTVKVSGMEDPSEIDAVKVPVWTEEGGQDDIRWYEARERADGWYVVVDTALHALSTGLYHIHAYAYDSENSQKFIGKTTFVIDAEEPVSLYAQAGDDPVYFTVRCTGIRNAKKVEAAVWGDADGQNDIRWYTMSRKSGTEYQIAGNLFDHLETGLFHCHLYTTGPLGNKQYVASTQFTVGNLKRNYLREKNTDHINGKFTAKLYFPECGKQIEKILFAVWTEENGQDDIYWYTAQKSNSDGSYLCEIDSLNHQAAWGYYNVHAYAACGDGEKIFLSKIHVPLGRTARRYQNPAPYYQIRDSITLDGGGYNLSYGYEGVKVMQVIRRLQLGSGIGMGGAFYSNSTANAVADFQRKNGLPATGIVDFLTWIRLGFNEIQWTQWGAYVSPMKVNRRSTREEHIEAMISTAQSYLGTAYVIGASGPPGTGIDCSGLVMQALYSAGLDLSPINPVRHAHPGYEYESRNMWTSPQFMHVPYEQRKRGDLIFYQNNSGVVIHVAIYLGNDQVIESWPNEVVIWPVRNWQRSNIKGVIRPFI